ncbi:MAG TPA: prephenate dehydrogenase/arogenate dehydrogenase family protein [Candidatus Thermoplasmatota archaeon]|nr:prephenate dehydrogenase/arogenate dehydrogenase family protein [Candidatus Thermoplasmatota archaeon]
MTAPGDLAKMREEIKRLDADIVRLAAGRVALARSIGEAKRAMGLPIRNYAVEAEVIADARAQATSLGLDPGLAEETMKLLIAEALRAQERDRRSASKASATGSRALVVGGRGAMGSWFCEFLDSKGMSVAVSDPRGAHANYAAVGDYRDAAGSFDVVVVAVPPAAAANVLDRLEGATEGLVFDIASLKSPLAGALRRLAAKGMNVTSVHPMWGPSTDLLASRNLVLCDCGASDATRAARALFEDTAANLVDVPLEEHDTYMAYTLGLPHALNIVFSEAARSSPYPLAALAPLGGPTFTKQTRVAAEVAHENAELYRQIQKLNARTPDVYAALREALARLEASLDDEAAFRAIMEDARRFHAGVTP